jgi:hypothetical protein
MAHLKLKGKLSIARSWKQLLAIEAFSSLPQPPQRWQETAERQQKEQWEDPQPYTKDHRESTLVSGDYCITLQLISGTQNYWLDYEVRKISANLVVYNSGEVFFDLPPGYDELKLADGNTITFKTQLK